VVAGRAAVDPLPPGTDPATYDQASKGCGCVHAILTSVVSTPQVHVSQFSPDRFHALPMVSHWRPNHVL
jgi:hypothetical protein